MSREFITSSHTGGVSFDVQFLIDHISTSGRDYIIQGGQNARRDKIKPSSLDAWLRDNFANNPDTKQATHEVIEDLVKTGLFCEGKFKCPTSGIYCKGIQIISKPE